MEAPPATNPLTTSNAKSGQKYHMTPASFFTGAPPGSSGQKKEIEKPRPSPAGPRKSLYAVISARETSLVHPLKVDSRMRERHMTVRWKPRITILPEWKRAARQRSCVPTDGQPPSSYKESGQLLSVGHFTNREKNCRVEVSKTNDCSSVRTSPAPTRLLPYSHSIVPGGLDVTSYTTRFTPFTSLMIRVAVSPRNFMSKG
jgi:hypothetical protein